VIASSNEDAQAIRVAGPWGDSKAGLSVGGRISRQSALWEHLEDRAIDLRVRSVSDGGADVDVVDRTRLLASLESKRVGAQRFSGSEKLGSGIQTIEKAKQASLVAIDLDVRHNGSVKPLEDQSEPKKLLSLVALGNGVHWTDKDRKVLGTYVDFSFIVKDAAIIRYADFLKEGFDEEDDFLEYFMEYFGGLTKQEEDAFEVNDDDFLIVAPEAETRSLRQVLRDHIDVAKQA
jgi:hypothetical protein